jgi:hypothetical protein
MSHYFHLLIVSSLLVVSACSNQNGNYSALQARGIKCPVPAQLEFRPWGKNGLMAICQIPHGPVAMAEGGHIVVLGENSMGKQYGEWSWIDEKGKVVRTERH